MKLHSIFPARGAIAPGLFAQPMSALVADVDPKWQAMHGGGRVGGAFASPRWERVAQGLRLSVEQRQAVHAIEDRYGPALRDLHQRLADNSKVFSRMTATDKRLSRLAAMQGCAIAGRMVLQRRMRTELDQILDLEQRQRRLTSFEYKGRHAAANDERRHV